MISKTRRNTAPLSPAKRGGFIFILVIGCLFLGQTAVGGLEYTIDKITIRSYFIEDHRTGNVIACKNCDRRYPIASVTKVVTALVARGLLADNDIVTVPAAAVHLEGARLKLRRGERYRFIDLLHAMLMYSGNDVAYSIAVRAAGSERRFVHLMNQWCKKNGFLHTRFADTSGLSNRSISTTRELNRIFRVFLSDPRLENILTHRYHTIKSLGGRETAVINNCQLERYRKQGVMGKTGQTLAAGHCFSGIAVHGNNRYLISMLGAKTTWREFIILLNYANSYYDRK